MEVDVVFEFDGKARVCKLSKVAGGGSSSMWHLMEKNFYCGCLHDTDYGWKYHGNSYESEQTANYLSLFVSASLIS